MSDILSNHKIVNIKTMAAQTAGITYSPSLGTNLQAENAYGQFERSTKALLLIEVMTVVTSGTSTFIIEQSSHQQDIVTAFSSYATLTAISSTGVYAVELKGFSKVVRIKSTVAKAAVTWGAKLITFDAVRRPVVQSGVTVITPTYL